MSLTTSTAIALHGELLKSNGPGYRVPPRIGELAAPLCALTSPTEQLELRLLLDALNEQHGYDFRGYAPASLLRRVRHAVRSERVQSISGLQERLLHDPDAIRRFISALSVGVTAMFRDPQFYAALRTHVVPLLRQYASIKIWHAGCASGEEVYSMAIVLHEAGLYDRCQLYGTDLSPLALQRARAGVFPIRPMREHTANYQRAGGTADFSRYYTAEPTRVTFRPFLRRNLTFFQHNLVSDPPIGEFQLVLCRNVMIYFNRQLRQRVHELLHRSLLPYGVLGLGTNESLRLSEIHDCYRELKAESRLFLRTR